MLGYIALFAGTLFYNKFLRDKEIRLMLTYAIFIGILGSMVSLVFALRWNLLVGIGDLELIIFSGVVTDVLGLAFSLLPTLVLFAKITPKKIEATVFAMMTGVFNLNEVVLSPFAGVVINRLFVHVSNENLESFYILQAIQLGCGFIPLLLIWLIPLSSEIKDFGDSNLSQAKQKLAEVLPDYEIELEDLRKH